MMLRQQPTVQGSQAIPAYQKPQITHVWYYSRSFAAYPCNFWTSWKADASQRNLKGLCIWPKNNATTVTTASMEPSPYRLWDGNVSLSRNDKLAGPYLILARTAAEERAIHASARRRTDRLEDRVSEPWKTTGSDRSSDVSGRLLKSEAKPFATEKGRRGGPSHNFMQLSFSFELSRSRQLKVLEVSPF